MARVLMIDHKMKVVCTIDQPVGKMCPNRREDVLLVQFLLKTISEGKESTRFKPPGRKPLQCDGTWGPESQAYLNHFIADVIAVNPTNPLTADGRVDPVLGGKRRGAWSGNLYTIIGLNMKYVAATAQPDILNIAKDPNFPAELRPAIMISA